MFWDGPSVCTSSHFLSCLSADLHLGLDISTSLGHRTWLHICLLLVVPVCSFGIKVSNTFQIFRIRFALRILSPPSAAPCLGSSFKTGSCVLSYQHLSLAINRQLCGNRGITWNIHGTFMEHSSEDLARVALMTICKYREPSISQVPALMFWHSQRVKQCH